MTKEGGGRPRRGPGVAEEAKSARGGLARGTHERGKRAFVEPELVKHETLTRLTLVSDFGGGGGGGGTFF